MSCEQSIRESRIDRSLIKDQNLNEHITASEDAMHIDLVPELPPSGGYENTVTAMDYGGVFQLFICLPDI